MEESLITKTSKGVDIIRREEDLTLDFTRKEQCVKKRGQPHPGSRGGGWADPLTIRVLRFSKVAA